MSDIEQTAMRYIAAWNENDDAQRMRLLEACWAANGTITSNNEHIVGRDAVFAAITSFRRSRPDDRAVLTSAIDHHHHIFRFTGHVVRPDGTSYSNVLDVGEVDADGRITRIFTFHDPPPVA